MSSTARQTTQSAERWEEAPATVRVKLSALWVSVMFLYVYVDIFSFYMPGTIDDILIGRVWEFDITQGWALGALALMAIPSLMVFLSLALPVVAARRANLVVATVYVLVSIGNAVGETWAFIWLGSAVEVALLLLLLRYAWTWPRRTD
jgi:Family of unknown function (DUF6326)